MDREKFYKSEGVRDCVKWLEKEIKTGEYLTPESIKISLEKYMKKLIHEAGYSNKPCERCGEKRVKNNSSGDMVCDNCGYVK